MSGVSLQGNEKAWGSHGATQRQLPTNIEAKLKPEETKSLLGLVNLSKSNDFSVEIPFVKDDGSAGKVYITPKDLETAKKVAKDTKAAESGEGASIPLTVYQNGKPLGTVDPDAILSK